MHLPSLTRSTLTRRARRTSRCECEQHELLRICAAPRGNRRAAAQYDYGLRVQRWMTHYLMGEGGEPPAPALDLAERLGLNDAE